MAAKKIKLNKNSVMEFLAGEVQQHVEAIAYEITNSVLFNTPVWSGQMVNSWLWSANAPQFKDVIHPNIEVDEKYQVKNPLDEPNIYDVLPKAKYGRREFPKLYFTNGKSYAFKIDQGVGKKGIGYEIVSRALQAAENLSYEAKMHSALTYSSGGSLWD